MKKFMSNACMRVENDNRLDDNDNPSYRFHHIIEITLIFNRILVVLFYSKLIGYTCNIKTVWTRMDLSFFKSIFSFSFFLKKLF